MARINTAAEDAPIFAALAASLGIMLCMIVSLLGIKIWWFKHRLTFDHSASSNGAAGGTPPAVPLRQRSSKDKRASEQYRASAEVHGVFRKRQEDDVVDVVRPTPLPPVRIRKISQSTPSLLLPPKKLDEPILLEPPTRNPPLTPIAIPTITTTTTIHQTAEVSIFDKVKPKEPALEINDSQVGSVETTVTSIKYGTQTEAQIYALPPPPPQAPKRFNRSTSNDAIKAKVERRPTGYTLGISAEDLQELEELEKLESIKEPAPIREESFGERSPIGYIRYGKKELAELEKLESIKEPEPSREEAYGGDSVTSYIKRKETELAELEKWESIKEPTAQREDSFGERAPKGCTKYDAAELKELEELQQLNIIKEPAPTSTEVFGERRPTGYIKYEEVDKSWQDLRAKSIYPVNGMTEAPTIYPTANEQPKGAACYELKQRVLITEYVENDDEHMWQSVQLEPNYKYEEPVTPDVTAREPSATHRTVLIEEMTDEPEAKSITLAEIVVSKREMPLAPAPRRVKFQAPANVVDTDEVYDKCTLSMIRQLRRPTSFENRSETLWQELAQNSKQDATEEQLWLEMQNDINSDFTNNIEEEFNKIRHSYHENEGAFLETRERKPQPTGFGKSIDEDWESFEHLAKTKESAAGEKATESSYEEVKIQHENVYTEVQKVSFKVPTGVMHSEERKPTPERRPTGYVTTLGLYDELDRDKDDNFGYKTTVRFDMEEEMKNPNKIDNLRLKERRPTGYITSIDAMFDEISDAKYDDSAYKSKVTFDLEEEIEVRNKNENSPLKERRPTGNSTSIDKMFDDVYRVDNHDELHDFTYNSKVNFDVEDTVETKSKNENIRIKERRPTGYVTSMTLFDERSTDKNDDYAYKSKVKFNVEEPMDEQYKIENMLLKERRPTGFEQRIAYVDVEDVEDYPKTPAVPQEPKAKPRVKVTFDFNTEEHYYPAGYHSEFDSDEDEEDEEEEEYSETPPAEMPKPMKRLPKIRYTEESFETLATPSPPILFSSQVSMDDSTSTEASDSWSAIRQHRHLTEEFQQLSLQQASKETPTPAYRNPLAQLAQSTAVRLEAEADYMQKRAVQTTPSKRTKQLDYVEYGSEA